jgi:hypothetical protein
MSEKVKLDGEKFHRGVQELHRAWTTSRKEKGNLWVSHSLSLLLPFPCDEISFFDLLLIF